MKILAFGGYTNAGKSTCADYVLNKYSNIFFKPPHIKAPMMEMAKPFLRALGVPEHEIIPRLDGDMKETPIPDYPNITGKLVQQVIGKDFRDGVDPTQEIFIRLWLDITRRFSEINNQIPLMESLRFPIELYVFERDPAIDPITIWVDREGCGPQTSSAYEPRLPTKYTITNNTVFEDAFEQIDNILEIEGLI